VERSGELVGCAFRTPPYKAGLTRMPAAAAAAVADDLRQLFDVLPAIMGPRESAGAFAARWLDREAPDPGLGMGIFQLTEVTPPPRPAAGVMRPAGAADLPLTAAWMEAFGIDADIPIGGEPENGDAVSMAVATGPTANGIRIGFVYTPPERRGHGYASVLVGALSQAMLDRGRRFCFLYTDLANPTSNAIYQRLGYRPVCEVFDFPLAPPE